MKQHIGEYKFSIYYLLIRAQEVLFPLKSLKISNKTALVFNGE